MLIMTSGCASSQLNRGADSVGNSICLTDCKDIPAAIEKFKKTHDLETERDEIDYLFYRIRSSNKKFDRNGTIYDGPSAAQFLRWKIAWYKNRHHEMITTDEDFVSKIFRGSEKTGSPYYILMENGKKYNAQLVMQNELNYLNAFNASS
jgi:hypothetical protein